MRVEDQQQLYPRARVWYAGDYAYFTGRKGVLYAQPNDPRYVLVYEYATPRSRRMIWCTIDGRITEGTTA